MNPPVSLATEIPAGSTGWSGPSDLRAAAPRQSALAQLVTHGAIKTRLLFFGKCYCAAIEWEPGAVRDDLDDLTGVFFPSRSRSAAEAKAARCEVKTGLPCSVTRWGRM